MSPKSLWVILISLLCLAIPGTFGGSGKDRSVAMVMKVQGKVTIERRTGEKEPASVMHLLYPGDHLHTDSNAEVMICFAHDHHRETLPAKRKVTVEPKGCEPQKAIQRREGSKIAKELRNNGYLELHNLKRSQGKIAATVVRGKEKLPEIIPQITPIYNAVIPTTRPSFAWQQSSGSKADSYLVSLCIDLPGEPLELWKVATKVPRLTYPKEKPLAPGEQHKWKVHAIIGNKKTLLVEGIFYVASSTAIKELPKQIKQSSESSDPAELLLIMGYFQHQQHIKEATEVCEKMAELSQMKDPGILVLLAAYYERAGRKKEAGQMRKKAEALGYQAP